MISFCVFHRKKKVILVSKDIRVSTTDGVTSSTVYHICMIDKK